MILHKYLNKSVRYYVKYHKKAFKILIYSIKKSKKVQEYLQEAIKFIEKYFDETNILDRIGELVDDEKRELVKKNLKNEVLKQLAVEIKVLG